MYDVNSKHADDFINHEEILDTLAYADENKHNEALIDSLIEKAKLRKGLSHREASVLLACDIEEKNQEIYRLAEQIKKDFYGNRIVMFAPLYLSNYCVNGCTYCPYHMKNKHIARKKLTQDEIRKEVIALQKIRYITQWIIIWNVLRLSIALSIRMVLSVVSISILRQQLLTITAC